MPVFWQGKGQNPNKGRPLSCGSVKLICFRGKIMNKWLKCRCPELNGTPSLQCCPVSRTEEKTLSDVRTNGLMRDCSCFVLGFISSFWGHQSAGRECNVINHTLYNKPNTHKQSNRLTKRERTEILPPITSGRACLTAHTRA